MLIDIKEIEQLILNIRRFDKEENGVDYFSGWDNCLDIIKIDLEELKKSKAI